MEEQLDVSVLSRDELIDKAITLQREIDELFDSYCDMREAAIKSDLWETAHNFECQESKRYSILIADLSKAYGLSVGIACDGSKRYLCIDLPSGQVRWFLASAEAETLELRFGRYEGRLEGCSNEEQHRRIENPGF